MPTIFFYGPELDREKKKQLISLFAKSASEVTGISESRFITYLITTTPQNVGVGSELLEKKLDKK